MAFVNERITDEDIEKYNLMDIWEKCIADEKVSVMGGEKPYDFAIDREREQWLIYLAMVKHEIWEPKIQNYTDEHIFIFYYNGLPYEVRLIEDKHKAIEVDGVPGYEITWSLKSINPEPTDVNTFKVLLKDALKTYGKRGVTSADKINNITCDF